MKRIGRAAAKYYSSLGVAVLVGAMAAGSPASLADSLFKVRLVDPSAAGDIPSNARPFRIADDATPPAAPPPLAPGPAPAANPASPPPLAPAPSLSDKVSQENMFWDSAQKSNSAADYKAYLDAFPNGVYAPLARNRIAALSAPPDAAQPSPAAPNQPAPGAPPANPPQQAEGGPPGAGEPASGPPAASPDALKGEVGTMETEQSLNMNHRDAMVVQQRLMELGLYGGPIDGDFGPGTRSAIAQWQQSHGAQPTGALGPLELATLQAESAPVNGQRVEGRTCPPGFHLGPYGHRCWSNR
jgi:Putative peptidoglycan binding domain